MKIMRAQFHHTIEQRNEPRRLHMNYPILILQNALRQQKLASHDGQPLPFVEIGRHDDVRNAGFIFHREEDKTLGRTGPLACNDTPRRFDVLAIPTAAKLCGREHISRPQFLASIVHRVLSRL